MNRSIIKLGGGLNTSKSPLDMDPGELIGSENYECRIEGGYRSLAGYEAYDGRPSPSSIAYVVLGADAFDESLALGDTVTGEDSGATGTVAYIGDTFIALIETTGTFEAGETIYVGSIDPFREDVVLLLQGGANGSTTLQDLSDYADSAAISGGAAWTSSQTVDGENMIAATQILPDIAPFTSSGPDSRFSRASGQPFTIELPIRWSSLQLTDPSGVGFAWSGPGGNLVTIKFYSNTGELALLNGSTNIGVITTLTVNTTYKIQITLSAANVLTVDVDGTEVYTGSASSNNSSGTYTFLPFAAGTVNPLAASWFAGPLRATRAARPRGSSFSLPYPL